MSLLALADGSPAIAQELPATALSLGVFLPSDSDTRRRATNDLISAEVRYALPSKDPAASRTTLAIDVNRSSRGEGSTIVGGTVGQLFSLGGGRSPLAAQTGYVGLGAGVYGLDLNGIHAVARVGAYGEIGYNLTQAVLASAQYRFVNRGNGATLSLGVRF